jgi:hypothetical protein
MKVVVAQLYMIFMVAGYLDIPGLPPKTGSFWCKESPYTIGVSDVVWKADGWYIDRVGKYTLCFTDPPRCVNTTDFGWCGLCEPGYFCPAHEENYGYDRTECNWQLGYGPVGCMRCSAPGSNHYEDCFDISCGPGEVTMTCECRNCTQCEPGFYRDKCHCDYTGICLPCPPNHYCINSELKPCSDCTGNLRVLKTCTHLRDTECTFKPMPPNATCPEWAESHMDCYCKDGYYGAVTGLFESTCQPCPPEHFCSKRCLCNNTL